MIDTAPTWSAMVRRAYDSAERALVWDGGSWTGRELLRRASGAAAWLSGTGVPEGSPVPALLSSTHPSGIALTIGAAAIGRPLAPLATRLTARELAPAVRRLSSPVLIAEPDAIGLAQQLVATDGSTQALRLPEFEPSDARLPTPARTDIAGYLHTSGTTGAPKPVALGQDRSAIRAQRHSELVSLGKSSVFVSNSPWHHIAGMGNVAVALATGATVLSVPTFDTASWHLVEDLHATHCLLVPSMIEMLLQRDLLRPGSLEVLIYGASPIHPETLRRVLELLPDVAVVNLFGQTEGSPITYLSAEDHRRAARARPELLHSVGRPAPGVELRIDNPDDAGVGEVWARAEHLMAPGPDGWLRTGDLGRLDGDGYLFLSGRLSDKIICGGENVFPAEVEEVLITHPAIAEVGIAGVEDRRLGQTVAAFLVPADPADTPDEAELARFARTHLAGFKVPTEWVVVDQLPRTASGKVQRHRLPGLAGR